MNWLKELANTTLRYWEDPPITLAAAVALFASASVLLVLARVPSFGFSTSETVLSVIASLLALFAQLIAGIAYILRPGRGDFSEDMPRFVRLSAVFWGLSLTLFLPNFFVALRWFGTLPSHWMTAALHSALAAALLYWSTIKRRPLPGDGSASKERLITLAFAIGVALVNTALFYLFVLSEETDSQLRDNLEPLLKLFAS